MKEQNIMIQTNLIGNHPDKQFFVIFASMIQKEAIPIFPIKLF